MRVSTLWINLIFGLLVFISPVVLRAQDSVSGNPSEKNLFQ